MGWRGFVTECPEGQTEYIGFAREEICNSYCSPPKLGGKNSQIDYHTDSAENLAFYWFFEAALFQRSARLPAGWLTRDKALQGVLTFKAYGGAFICAISSETSYFLSRLCIIFVIAY